MGIIRTFISLKRLADILILFCFSKNLPILIYGLPDKFVTILSTSKYKIKAILMKDNTWTRNEMLLQNCILNENHHPAKYVLVVHEISVTNYWSCFNDIKNRICLYNFVPISSQKNISDFLAQITICWRTFVFGIFRFRLRC